MKPRVLLVIGLFALIGLLLWLVRSPDSLGNVDSAKDVSTQTASKTESATDEPDQEAGDRRTPQERLEELARSRGVSLNVLTQQLMQAAATQFSDLRQQALEKMGEDFKWPITFYGRVLDKRTNSVPEANVQFSWLVPYPNEPAKRDTISDANGLFELTGATGRTLTVRVNKPGYYTSSANQLNFEYSQKHDAVPHNPDPNNPVIFRLHKQGTGVNLITSRYGVTPNFPVSVPRDGTPIAVDLLHRKFGAEGPLQIMQIKPEYLDANKATAWRFRMEIRDGGFVEHTDEFPFEAPESGYQPVIDFDFKVGETNWATALARRYYIVFGQPRQYGWLSIETRIGSDGARLEYAINPDGSRNLEPKPPSPPPRRELPPGVTESIPDHIK